MSNKIEPHFSLSKMIFFNAAADAWDYVTSSSAGETDAATDQSE